MRTYEELKKCLIEIRDNDYNVPDGADVDGILDDMLRHIGHADGEFRDKLIYKTFVQWGESKKLISAEKMTQILGICLSDTHLFYGIGENGTDSVFTRSFSSLVLSVAFCVHDDVEPFLGAQDVQSIKETVLRYIAQEKDYRGYVEGKGWAHAVAHIADALYNVVGCEIDGKFCNDRDSVLEILQGIKTLVCNEECVYGTEEDERLAAAVMMVIWSEALASDDIIAWIDGFNMADNEWWKGSVPSDYYPHINRKNFMRSLYFKLLADGDFEAICEHMKGFLIENEG